MQKSKEPDFGRAEGGRFDLCNPFCFDGGRARAERLTPERRKEIARKGWHAVVQKRFGGDYAAAKRYFGMLGAWAAERAAFEGSPFYKPNAYPHPGPMPGLSATEDLADEIAF